MLITDFGSGLIEAGVDEAGRGCLAGPVYAAAVILPKGYANPLLDDSKKLSRSQRETLRPLIERDALACGLGRAMPDEIDSINILNASFLAMHRAIEQLPVSPQLLLIDGNRFRPYPSVRHQCIIRGDSLYMAIAAASILAKTYRDEYMEQIHGQYPVYNWLSNKGYPTAGHRKAIATHGLSEFHRKTFRVQFNLFDQGEPAWVGPNSSGQGQG